jgi:hypothetical protein
VVAPNFDGRDSDRNSLFGAAPLVPTFSVHNDFIAPETSKLDRTKRPEAGGLENLQAWAGDVARITLRVGGQPSSSLSEYVGAASSAELRADVAGQKFRGAYFPRLFSFQDTVKISLNTPSYEPQSGWSGMFEVKAHHRDGSGGREVFGLRANANTVSDGSERALEFFRGCVLGAYVGLRYKGADMLRDRSSFMPDLAPTRQGLFNTVEKSDITAFARRLIGFSGPGQSVVEEPISAVLRPKVGLPGELREKVPGAFETSAGLVGLQISGGRRNEALNMFLNLESATLSIAAASPGQFEAKRGSRTFISAVNSLDTAALLMKGMALGYLAGLGK